MDAASDSVEGVYDTYLFELPALDPYPQATDEGEEQPDYTATLVVSKLEADQTSVGTSSVFVMIP